MNVSPASSVKGTLPPAIPRREIRVLRNSGERRYANGYLHISCVISLDPDGAVLIRPKYEGSFTHWTFDADHWITAVEVENRRTGEVLYRSTLQPYETIRMKGVGTLDAYQVCFYDGRTKPIIATEFILESAGS